MKQGVFLRQMAADATEAVIDVVGVIGWDVGFQQLREILRAIPETVGRVVFDIYSPGGDVWDGNAIIHEIGGMKQETVARVRVAASMATLIAVACKHREMSQNGRWLIHNPWTATQGDAEEFEKRAKELRDAENEAAAFYAARTGKTPDEMLALMSEERWLTPQEALDYGFIQRIDDPFAESAYAPIREAITAAGRWPQALAVEVPDVSEPTDGAEVVADAGQSAPAAGPTEDELRVAEMLKALEAEFQRGHADGFAAGRLAGLAELGDQAQALAERLAAAERVSAAHQSRADRAEAEVARVQRAADERCAALRADLEATAAKLKTFLAGALTFEPSVETWEEAMTKCGNDYARAAEKYPELLKQFRAKSAGRK